VQTRRVIGYAALEHTFGDVNGGDGVLRDADGRLLQRHSSLHASAAEPAPVGRGLSVEKLLQERAQSAAWELQRLDIVEAARRERGGTDFFSLQEQRQLDKEAAARERSEALRRLAREARAERACCEALEAARLRDLLALRAAPPEAEARVNVASRTRSASSASARRWAKVALEAAVAFSQFSLFFFFSLLSRDMRNEKGMKNRYNARACMHAVLLHRPWQEAARTAAGLGAPLAEHSWERGARAHLHRFWPAYAQLVSARHAAMEAHRRSAVARPAASSRSHTHERPRVPAATRAPR